MLRLVLLVAMLFLSAASSWAQAPGARDPEVNALRIALAALQQEQQAVYQQFQMIQGLRAAELPPPNAQLSYTPPPTPPNYDDLVRDRDRASARQADYVAELQRLYGRYREIEEQKRPLIERLAELTTTR
jgi:type II secretory pathway pseudopilin PulG